MLKRLTLLFVSFAFLLAMACGGTKGGSSSKASRGGGYDDDDYGYSEPPPKANELKDAYDEATNLTEENHKMAREIFELKNKLGISD